MLSNQNVDVPVANDRLAACMFAVESVSLSWNPGDNRKESATEEA